MMLDEELGWSEGDDIRVLVALGIGLGYYQKTQIIADMNYLGNKMPEAVPLVLEAVSDYEGAQDKYRTLNSSTDTRTLIKADVLEWESSVPGVTYGPEREVSRARSLLQQYFSFSTLLWNSPLEATSLIRS